MCGVQRGAGEGEGAEIEVVDPGTRSERGILLTAFILGGRNRVMLKDINGYAFRSRMRRSGHGCLFCAGWISWKHFLLKKYLSTGRGDQKLISSCHINPLFLPQSLVLLPSSASEPPAVWSHLLGGLIYLLLGFSDKAVTPGSSLPSSNSKLAPPPVDT